ncbi:DUF421 domain-containing protein [Alkalihalobacterium bogoriense]|uniref:DUF421 domain-containing protein n=1 Tax=Alkalihalobacterium bogoriense TaxID=246272 RepID=UPI00047BC6D8|nr:DUF421 domain-containing protein [Alkalihalobacterium bogoriense]
MNEIVITLLRTFIVFLVLLTMFRFMGKKELGEISLLDVVVSLMIAELAVISIEDHNISLIRGLAPIFLLILLQVILGSIGMRNQSFRKLVEGSPVMLIEDGKLIQENLQKHRYTLDDILFQLRQAKIADIREVEYAVLERSGTLSIFRKGEENSQFTLPLVLDGVIQENNLRIIKRTKDWLLTELEKEGYYTVDHIFYCSYMDDSFFIEMKDHGT